MRILFLTDIPPDTGSWIGRYHPLLKQLSEHDHHVTVIQPRDREAPVQPVENTGSGCTVEYVPKGYRNGTSNRTGATLKLILTGIVNLYAILKKGFSKNFDLICVGKPLPVSSTAALIIGALKRTPIHLDCDDYEIFTNQVSDIIQHRMVRFFEDVFPKFCRSVSTHNHFLMDRLKKIRRSDEHLFFISNGIDAERLNSHQGKPSPPKKNVTPQILYFGDLNRSTGHSVDLLIRAFKIILDRHRNHDVKLTVVGDGKDESYLRRLAGRLQIDKSIEWVGRVPPDRIGRYIQNSDIVMDPVSIHPGNITRCPLKILEAMYMGIPVVTSDVGDRQTLLGKYGIYSVVGDAESLADKTVDLLADKRKRMHLGQKLKERSENFLWDKLAKDFEHILTSNGEI